MEEVVRRVRIDVTSNAGQATRGLESLRSTLHGISGRANSVKQGANSLAHSFKSISSATKLAQKHTSKYMSTLKRVLLYRAIRYALKAIIDGFKQGLENAYWFSKGISGDLAQALDLMAVKGQTMKNQLGAAFGGLLQTIQPIILTIINLVTKLAEAITMLFSMFGGRGTYLKAVDASAAFKKNTGGAAKEAKKIKDYLMSIDELNVINNPDDTGSGGGGGNAGGWASMFEEAQLPDWMKNIQDLLNLDMFKTAGAYLADHLNGLIADWDANAWGEKLGQKIENALEFAWGFLYGKTTTGNGFSFDMVGKKLQEAISGMLSKIDPKILGAVLVGKFNAIIGLAKGFLQGFSASATGQWLGSLIESAITSIRWHDLGTTLSGLVRNLVNTVASAVETVDWTQIGSDISDFISTLDVTGIIDAFMNLFVAASGAIHEVLVGLFKGEWEKVVAWWDSNAYDEGGKFDLMKLLDGMLSTLKGINEWMQEHIQKPINDAINKLFGIDSQTAKDMEEHGKLLPGHLITGIKAWNPLNISGLGLAKKIYDLIKGDTDDNETDFIQIGKNILNFIKDGVFKLLGELNPFKGAAQRMYEKIRDDASDVHTSFEGIGDNFNKYIKDGMQKAKKVFDGIGGTIAGWLKSDSLKTENTDSLKETGKSIMGSIWDGLKQTWEDIKTWWSNTKLGKFFSGNGNSEDSDPLGLKDSEPVTFAIDINGVITAATEAGKQANEAFSKAFYASDSGGLFAEMKTQFTTVADAIIEKNSTTMSTLEESFRTMVNNVAEIAIKGENDMMQAYDLFVKYLDDTFGKFVDKLKTDYFPSIEAGATDMMQNIWDYYDQASSAIAEDFSNMIDYGETEFRRFIDKFKVGMQEAAGTARQEISAIREALEKLNGYTVHVYIKVHEIGGGSGVYGGTGVDKLAHGGIVKFAHGGIIKAANGLQLPNRGQLFVAREAGAELVGDIGNGRTAVMNNNQIVQSVSDGVYSAVMSAMSQQGSSSDDRPIVLQIDGREIARAVRKGERQTGYQLSSNPTFA